jgi:hypothetical protein
MSSGLCVKKSKTARDTQAVKKRGQDIRSRIKKWPAKNAHNHGVRPSPVMASHGLSTHLGQFFALFTTISLDYGVIHDRNHHRVLHEKPRRICYCLSGHKSSSC